MDESLRWALVVSDSKVHIKNLRELVKMQIPVLSEIVIQGVQEVA